MSTDIASDSAGPLASLDPAALAGWLGEASRLFEVLEDYERPASEHLSALRHARTKLRPLLITPNSDVRSLVVNALKALNKAPGLLANAAAQALRRDNTDLGARQVIGLLQLLVDSGGEGLDEVASLARDHLVRWLDDDDHAEALQVALVELAGISGGAMAVFAMVERIGDDAKLHWAAAFAALRQIAQRPGVFGLGLSRILRAYDVSSIPAEIIRPLLSDLISRMSPEVVLAALVDRDPGVAPSLYKGAFGEVDGEPALFRIVDRVEVEDATFSEVVWSASGDARYVTDDMDASEVDVPRAVVFEHAGAYLAFDDLLPKRKQDAWLQSLRGATGLVAEPELPPWGDVPFDLWASDAASFGSSLVSARLTAQGQFNDSQVEKNGQVRPASAAETFMARMKEPA